MPVQEAAAVASTDWSELAAKMLPWLIVLAGLLWAVIELRVRRIVDAKVEKFCEGVKEDLRREFQKPIGEIGIDAMQALQKIQTHETQIAELKAKTDLFWNMVQSSTADLLRHRDGE